jgi:superfamily I DNA/RNA helicase
MSNGGRLMAIGDPAQSIYAFRGADARSFESVGRMFDCAQVPLSICYRCSRAVVGHAQSIVPYIDPADSAPEGVVLKGVRPDWRALTPDVDAILSRNNAPLMRLALSLVATGIGARITGREFAKGLQRLVERFDGSPMSALLDELHDWRSCEKSRLLKADKITEAENVEDRYEGLIAVIESLSPRATVADLSARLDHLFDERRGVLELSTIHRSKGKEWERVWILRSDLMLPKWLLDRADREKQQHGKVSPNTQIAIEQETNLKYIAFARARHGLYLMDNEIERAS